MNILIEGGNLNPIKEGTRNIAISYAKKLLERGHNVIVLTKRKNQATGEIHKKFGIVDGIKFYRWSNHLNLFFIYRKIRKKEKIDIFHTFARGVRPKKFSKFIKSFKVPLILSLLGDPFNNRPPKNAEKFFKEIDKILVSSKTISKLPYLNKKNTEYLPYGIDTKKFFPKKQKTKKKEYKILYLRPPPIEFLEACRKLSKSLKIMVFVNKEKIYFDEIRNFLKENKEIITFVKFIENVEELYKEMDLFVDLHKDKYLGSASPPLTILEAMACGLKVVSTKMPEIEEFIRDNENGFLVKENSPEEIAEKMKQALESKKKIGENARKTILKMFNLNKLILKYEKEYEKLIRK